MRTNTMFVDVRELLAQAKRAFDKISADCEHSSGGGCTHLGYHKDFALVNLCKIENCPRCKGA